MICELRVAICDLRWGLKVAGSFPGAANLVASFEMLERVREVYEMMQRAQREA